MHRDYETEPDTALRYAKPQLQQASLPESREDQPRGLPPCSPTAIGYHACRHQTNAQESDRAWLGYNEVKFDAAILESVSVAVIDNRDAATDARCRRCRVP